MKALVLFSGGQDSTTCLAWALKHYEPEALSLYYGQRHYKELNSAKKICALLDIQHHVKEILLPETSSALLNPNIDISAKSSRDPNLPASFVPMRNYFFLGYAAVLAYQKDISRIIIGVSQEDYSGYPDCRESFLKRAEMAITHGLNREITIEAPLLYKTKVEIINMMQELEMLHLYKHTWTCYEGREKPCMKCPACKLRIKGFKEAGIFDPALKGGTNE